jgi:hypothetical protein
VLALLKRPGFEPIAMVIAILAAFAERSPSIAGLWLTGR